MHGVEGMKVFSGAMWNLFYADKEFWPEDSYHDDTVLVINGVRTTDADLDDLPPTATVAIECGYVMFPDGCDFDLADHFKRWEERQVEAGFVFGGFRVSKEKAEMVRQAIVLAGGELVG